MRLIWKPPARGNEAVWVSGAGRAPSPIPNGREEGPMAEGEVRRVLGGEVMPVPLKNARGGGGDWPKSLRTGSVALRFTGGGDRALERRTGAGDPARAERLAGAGEGRLGGGGGDFARVEIRVGAGDGRLGAGDPARGGGERRVARFGAGEGRRGAGDLCLAMGGGGERWALLRRGVGVKEVLLSVPWICSRVPSMMTSDSLSSGSSMSSSSSSSISGSEVGKVGSMSCGINLCLAASRSLIRVM